MELNFTIPLDPKSKKNSQRIIRIGGSPRIAQGAVYSKYEKLWGQFMPKLAEPITSPVNVRAVFYRETRRRVDLSNLQAALCDILAKYGVVADDCRDIVASMDGSAVYWDKKNPRTEVTITGIEGYEQWKTE